MSVRILAGHVLDRLRRDCIGIELNPDYVAMARRRIETDAPLLAEVTDGCLGLRASDYWIHAAGA